MFVLVPPEWIVKPHDMEAVEGQDVFFPCRVSGVPEPSIIWRKLAGKSQITMHYDIKLSFFVWAEFPKLSGQW